MMALVIYKPIPETPEKMFQQLMALIVQIAEKKEALSEDEVFGAFDKGIYDGCVFVGYKPRDIRICLCEC